MSKIISIGTSLPEYSYTQDELLWFADKVYSTDVNDSRKLKFLYNHSGIENRYSVLPDYTKQNKPVLFTPSRDAADFPGLEARMNIFNENAYELSVLAIKDCINGKISAHEITHLITVTCTGISAPGMDLQIVENMGLNPDIVRSSVNFMGCYAAIHALKLADVFCKADADANVVIVCTELCTLHFQHPASQDNITSSLLFGDGAGALLIKSHSESKAIHIKSFFSDVSFQGKKEMAWEVSSQGFLMTLTGYVPDLIKQNFKELTLRALKKSGFELSDVTHWCIHPGGKKILESISSCLEISNEQLACSYEVLRKHGNMSSATVIFVLKEMLGQLQTADIPPVLFAAAFGPGLTMETFTATYD